MRIAIAGGTGFLGGHVVSALTSEGHSAVLISRGRRDSGEPRASVVGITWDAASAPAPAGLLRGYDALVNLIGIKRETGTQTFERVHVDATRHLLLAASQAGIRRVIQISVVCSRPDARSAYHDSKWRAEELVRRSGLDWTILKPGVIYGRGDDMLTHLVKMIRFSPIFPVVGKGRSILQPIAAADVASMVLAALGNKATAGKSYDCVGPVQIPLRNVVRIVAQGIGLKVFILATPVWLQRLAVRLMNAVSKNPLSTPAQLQMLIDGMTGDCEPAMRDLGVKPGRLTPERVGELGGHVPPLFGLSLRVRGGRSTSTISPAV
ncbi:MAG TPA: complex I NDUFA9 subunit family protein [Planctomycetota bacterium]|nr:complex I NDUFA9 subunit family protein [Planctomycetota bacterium]